MGRSGRPGQIGWSEWRDSSMKYSATLDKISNARKEYVRLLSAFEGSTERLASIAQGTSMEGLEQLLEERDGLCRQFGPATASLAAAIRELNDLSRSSEWAKNSEVCAARKEIDLLHGRSEALIARQVICEQLLTEQANRCRTELANLGKNAQYLNAYSGNSRQSARYLDSRL
jgi:hypothetical protein